MKALVIDTLASPLRDLVREAGCEEIHVVETAGDALRAVHRVRPDVMLLDLDSLALDGTRLCRALAALVDGVPLVTAGDPDDATIERAIAAGAHDHVGKPLRPREVCARVRAALRVRGERLRAAERELALTSRTQELERSKRELESVALVDGLTGVANRRHFDHVLHAEWRRATRQRSPLSLVMIDLDDFHAYNAHYGHIGGDDCLRRVAEMLACVLRRPSDLLARYGGEEFAAVLPETDEHGACVVAERLRACIDELAIPHLTGRVRHHVTISAGAATRTPSESMPLRALVAAADGALFRAKREGRNRARAEVRHVSESIVKRTPWPASPRVIADPALVDRIPKFLESRRTDATWLRTAAHAGDFGRIAMQTRHVIDLASELGFAELAGIATRLAELALARNTTELLPVVEELATYVERVHVVYQRPTKQAG